MKTKLCSCFLIPPLTFVSLVVLALSAATSRANLLVNPGFEAGSADRVSDWTWFGNAYQSTNHARGGMCSLKLYGNWSGPGNASGVYQTLPARPGQRWTLSGYGLNASDDALAGQNYALMKIVWFSGPDGTGEELQPLPGPGALFGNNPGIESAQLTNGTPTDMWQFLSATGVAPPGTMSVQLLGGLFIQPGTDAGAAWFDDLKASATPVWGYALSFDGVDDYVEFDRLVSHDFTLECWFRSTQMTGEDGQWWQGMGLIDGEVNGLAADFGLSLGAGKVLFGTGGASDTTIQSRVVADGQWHHVAATREQASGTMKLYVDGQLVATGTGGTNSLTSPPQMHLGSLATGTHFFQGELDDVRIWDKARTAAEISQSMIYPLTGVEAHLVAYAKCDEGGGTTLQDTVSEVQVTLQNGVQWTPSTIPLWGNALSFDGVNDYVQAGAVPLTNSSFTVELWAKRGITGVYHILASQGTAASENRCWQFVYTDTDKVGFTFWGPGVYTQPFSDTNWHHWAATYSVGDDVICIYRDGTLAANVTNSAINYQQTGPVYIGRFFDPAFAHYFKGVMDEVRIWNKARTQAEIATDMRHPLTGSEANLVTYWSLDEATGSLVQDGTLNHHDGILTNGTTRVSSIISPPNLAVNPGFEEGTVGWWAFGSGSTTLKNSGLLPRSGTNCIFVTNRMENWQGLQQQFENVLQPGLNYLISGWVRLENAVSQPVYLTMFKTDSSGTSYPGVAGGTATSNAWTRLSGSYTPIVSGMLTNLWLYMSGPDAGVNFYADDFIVAPDMAYASVVFAATTLPASGMINSNATLNGMVQPGGLPTTAWFEWGTGWVYDHATDAVAVGNGFENLSVSNALTGLAPGRIYHYRLVASNSVGLVCATNQTFWLPALCLNSPDPLTNECHAAFVDPGARVSGYPVPIAGGGYHSLALQADGKVVGWGNDNYGQATGVPNTNSPYTSTGMVMLAEGPLSNVVAIEAGLHFSLALKADGTVVGWGRSDYGQTNIPAIATNVVAIAAGHWHNLALRANGTVVGWGRNDNGQATGVINGEPGLVTLGGTILSNVVAISGGYCFSLALKADGTVIGWGDNDSGQANGATAGSNVVAIAAGGAHSLALKADGTVVSWGYNWYGQVTTPVGLTNAVAIAAGEHHSLALRANGTVVGWGYQANGQANGALAGSNVVAIAAGHWHSLALRADNSIVGFGAGTTDTGSDPHFGQATSPGGLNTLPYPRSLNTMPYTVSGTVDTNTPGNYELTYRTTNALGAVATINRTVVVADTLPPILTLLGENPLMLEIGAPFTDPGATAADQCGGDLTANIVFTNAVNPNLAGAYTNTFTVTDANRNVATTNRLVLVVTRPVLTGLTPVGDSAFQFTFTSTPGACFNVLTATNLSLPTSEWTVLGLAIEGPPGQFQFMDVTSTNPPQRFYRLRWP